jgi:thiamine monophosphate kinase
VFTCSPEQLARIEQIIPDSFPEFRVVGTVIKGEAQLYLVSDEGREEYQRKGFDHFA